MGTFKVFFNVALSFLLLVHPSVQQPKIVDFSVLDVSSKALLRIEHLLAELLDIVSKAVPYHERHIQLLSKQIAAENAAPKQENVPAQENHPKPSIVVDVSRKSFLSRLHELENSFDNANSLNNHMNNNANVNTNTNVNTNSNTNLNSNVRKRPLTNVYLNDDLI